MIKYNIEYAKHFQLQNYMLMQQTDSMCKIWMRNNISYNSDQQFIHYMRCHPWCFVYTHVWSSQIIALLLTCPSLLLPFVICYWKPHFYIYPWVSGVACASQGQLNASAKCLVGWDSSSKSCELSWTMTFRMHGQQRSQDISVTNSLLCTSQFQCLTKSVKWSLRS